MADDVTAAVERLQAELAELRARYAAVESAAAALRTAVAARTGSPSESTYTWVARVSRFWPSSVSSQRKASRSTCAVCQYPLWHSLRESANV